MGVRAWIVGAARGAVHAALGAAAALGLLVGASCTRAPDRPNVLLIVVDTLRADHLSAYGYERDTSPALKRFAAGAARFTHAQSPRAKTTPAVASLLSGLYPHDHGARDLATPLAPSVRLLPEVLAERGYRTLAIAGNYVLTDRRSGLARAFRQWTEDLPDVGPSPEHPPERRAASLTDGALVALGLAPPGPADGPGPHQAGVTPGAPWFLYLHYMDPHGGYDPPREHRVFAAAEPDPIPRADELPAHPIQRVNVAEHNVPAEARLSDGRIDAAAVRALYDAEVRYADAEIGRLLERLEEAGVLEHTLVIVTADHGESLGEHRYWFEHGFFAYETTCRVPLLIRGPGVRSGVVREDISLVDVAPTVLELCGIDAGALVADAAAHPFAGVSRKSLVDGSTRGGESGGGSGASHPVFSEKIDGLDLAATVQIKAVRVADWKLIRRYTVRAAADGRHEQPLVLSEELYDLAADPGETSDLASAPPAAAPLAELRAELERFTAAEARFGQLASELQRERERLEREEPEAARMLRALGY